jgi:hypothetical protein
MPTDWIRQHVRSGLVTRYEREMQKLRGEHSDQHAIEENIKKLIADEESIETDEQRRARDLDEDAAMEEFLKKSKGEK